MSKRPDLMAPYRPKLIIPKEKSDELFALVNEMNTQKLKEFTINRNLHLNVEDSLTGDNLIHKVINIINSKIKEFHKLNMIKFLYTNGVNPDEPNKENQTPLALACKYQYTTIVNYLVNLGVDINYQDNFGSTPLLVLSFETGFTLLRMCACAAALTFPHNSMVESSSSALVFTFGLAITSTAPYSNANNAESVPFSVKVEITTTGIGCWDINFFKKVNPSIRGISISRVITSGLHSLILSTAINGSAATPIISIIGSVSKMETKVCLTNAESSTISTFTLSIITCF